MRKLPHFIVTLLVISLAMGGFGLAQRATGDVEGTVKDSSGAVIPGAEITLTNTATNQVREGISDDEGRFFIPQLPNGDYTASAQLTGFKTASVDFHMDVAARQNLNFVLEVGDITETVEVSDVVQRVNTEEGTLSSVVTGKQVEDLPLNGRNVFQLALLQPGVTQGINDGIGGESSINASGNRVRGNNFSLDGVSNNDPITGGSTSITPNLDTVAEFRIENNNFSAEFGRNNGSVVNVVTKSGTNDFHGSVYWYHRNDALDAREFFDGADPAPLRRHQAGFTIGGPIIKDKTFWYFGFEAIHEFSGNSSVFSFETPEFREYAQSVTPNATGTMLMNQFPGPTPTSDIVDVGSISGLFANAGAPDGIPDRGTVAAFSPDLNKDYQYNIRVDHELTDSNKLFFRYMWQTGESPPSNIRFDGFGNEFDAAYANGVISDTHIFSPTIVNEARFGYNRNRTDFVVAQPEITDFNIFNWNGSDSIQGFGAYGGTPQFFTAEEYHLVDVVSLNFGDHGIKAGFEYRWNQDDSDFQFLTRGYTGFAGMFDFAANLPYELSARIDPRQASGTPELVGTPHNFRQSEFAFFFQDDWKFNDRLTLNLGIRYDNYGQVQEPEGRLANIILGPGSNIDERITTATVGAVDADGIFKKDNNNFSPRFGFAYDVFGDGKTSLRGGFGVAYDRLFLNVTGNIRFNPPFSSNLGLYPLRLAGDGVSGQEWSEFISTGTVVPFQLPNGVTSAGFNAGGGPLLNVTFPGATPIQLGGRISLRAPDPQLKTSYSMNWFLGVQRELPWDMIFEANYVGNGGRKLGFIEQYNRFDGDRFGYPHPITGDPNATRLNEFFTSENLRSNNISSSHHGGNVSIQKRFSRGLAFQSAFTFGKTLDYGSDNFSSNAGSIFSVDPRRQFLEKGLASFDIRARSVSNVIWEIPYKKDQEGVLGQALGGWQLQSVFTFQNGSPFTPQAFSGSRDYNGDFRNNDRPDAPAGGSEPYNGLSTHQYTAGVFGTSGSASREIFNPNGVPCNRGNTPAGTNSNSTCTDPASGTLGRSNFIGPGFKNIDFSLFKNFRVPWFAGEDARLQFRAEFFNMTNRVNLTQPNRSFTSGTFGRSTGANDAREIQLALKFIF